MRHKIKRLIVFFAGIICALAGIIGLVFPLIPGFILLPIGIVLLSLSSYTFQKWAERHTQKFPKLHLLVKKAEARIGAVLDMG